jgi:hypothetical protein
MSIKLFYLYQIKDFRYIDNYFFIFISSLFTDVRIMKGKRFVLIYFSDQIDSGVLNPSIYSAVFLATPYYNNL